MICADNDPFYVEMIGHRFGHLENVQTELMDLARPGTGQRLQSDRPDTIISLNVLEHIEHDRDVLQEFFEALVPGGRAIVLVPAHPWLYTDCDRTLGHFRRYTPEELTAKFTEAGFRVESAEQFNRLGVLGWWVSGKLGKKELSPFQMRIYEFLLPLAKLMDSLRLGPGLSLIVVGQKPGDPTAARLAR